MNVTKNKISGSDKCVLKRPLRGGGKEYFIFYNRRGQGFAFTDAEIVKAAERWEKMDEGDAGFLHQWTFLRWLVGLMK